MKNLQEGKSVPKSLELLSKIIGIRTYISIKFLSLYLIETFPQSQIVHKETISSIIQSLYEEKILDYFFSGFFDDF